jgi:hypothetical protein
MRKRKGMEERPADLLFWFGDGACTSLRARVAANTEVSIGRTNSQRALGFLVTVGRRREIIVDFVLDRDQVADLATYLQLQRGRLRKPLGRKPKHQMSLAATLKVNQRADAALDKRAKLERAT